MLKDLHSKGSHLTPASLTSREINQDLKCDIHEIYRYYYLANLALNITMRFIRPSLSNKDNKENAFQNSNEKERMEELRL